jgi:hypothetical protein
MSGFGFRSQSAFNVGDAPTRYGGIVDNTDVFKSRHVHAVPDSLFSWFPHAGVHHSAGQPLQADGTICVNTDGSGGE